MSNGIYTQNREKNSYSQEDRSNVPEIMIFPVLPSIKTFVPSGIFNLGETAAGMLNSLVIIAP